MKAELLPRVLICRSNPIHPDPRVEKEARALANAGYSVGVVGWDMRGDLPRDEEKDGYRIHRRVIKAKLGRGLQNVGHELRWQIALALWLVRNRNSYDILHACDFDTVLPAMVCKWLYGKRVVYDVFDFYADMLRATPRLIKSMIKAVDLWLMGKVDAVILADEAREAQISGTKPKRQVILYNSPEDLDAVSPGEGIPHPKDAKLRIAYVGALHADRGLYELLSVLHKHPEWLLDLAGFGRDENELLRIANELENVHWYGRVPYEQALQISKIADVLVATYNPRVANHRYTSPNKVFEAMMLGKPVIVARGTSVDEKVQLARCGIVVEYGDINELEQALLDIEQGSSSRLLGQNSRKAYCEQYAWWIMAERLVSLYQEIFPVNQTGQNAPLP